MNCQQCNREMDFTSPCRDRSQPGDTICRASMCWNAMGRKATAAEPDSTGPVNYDLGDAFNPRIKKYRPGARSVQIEDDDVGGDWGDDGD